MRNYEVMYILKADLDEAARNELIAKVNGIITDNGGKILSIDEKMGLRELAYPIKDQTKGYYVVVKISADNKATSEFDRLVKINPNVLRHLITVAHE
ncbi:MAG: 30S ribosomal protein S6 [Erysipelotrichaceae bacterium]|jgi:small subunit ribosomal protein S6|nr:30S ribosomal protein S6 [Erysipelotrichaceae bacterium]